MKRLEAMPICRSAAAVILIALLLAGCAVRKPATTTLPTGALNSFDASTNRVLQDAHAFLASIAADQSSGKISLGANTKAMLNQAITDLNAADAVYIAWHNAGGTTSTAPVSTALTRVQTDIGQLQAQIPKGTQ